jgi:hypothetical protein
MKAPVFSGGNKWFAKALNLVVEYSKRHGVNPAGRAGWSQTADGWMPPLSRSASDGGLSNWDIEIIAPSGGGNATAKLYDPRVIWSRDDVSISVNINNPEFTPEADAYVVATMDGPIDTWSAAPSISIAMINEGDWDSFPSCYQFETSDPFEWEKTTIPIWKFYADGSGPANSISIGNFGDGLIYGEKLIGAFPSLFYALARVTGESRNRVVPTIS